MITFLPILASLSGLILSLLNKKCVLQEGEQNVGCSLNLRRSDLLLMPLPMFELIHLGAYNIELLVSYIRVMSFLDLDLVHAKQVIHRSFCLVLN